VAIAAAVASILFLVPSTAKSVTRPDEPPRPLTVEEKILAAFPDAPIMLEVAYCESGVQTPDDCWGPINPKAKNPYSTAKGVFQILDGTWEYAECKGDPYNEDDNIACARILYEDSNTRPWNASKHAWGAI